MKERTLRILEFNKIKDKVEKYAITSSGKEMVHSLKPYKSIYEVEKKLEEIQENITNYSDGDLVQEIFEEANFVKEYYGEQSRWSIQKIEIYEYKGMYIKAIWDEPATEIQEGQETNLSVYEVKAYKKEVLGFE